MQLKKSKLAPGKIFLSLLLYHSCQSIIRIFHKCEIQIYKSVPRVTVWHHEAPLSDAKL